ncbi:MAG: acetyl-CoA hydrolase/transferase, partial [Candidatus Krumholzibacteriota bacterium]|nr:acetyl-CoA hydrolase/transferase [Candidatus Krumholzibacteriota bacterium]
MSSKTWQQRYAEKVVPPREALSRIRNGQTVFVGSGAGEPMVLTDALYEMTPAFCDIEIIHLATAHEDPKLARAELAGSFRYNALYVGRYGAAEPGGKAADYTPMNVSELPKAMASGAIHVDVALIQVSPPDAHGMCNLGVSVDATKAAAESAKLVIAQVNPRSPTMQGDAWIHVDSIRYLVEGDQPLPTVAAPVPDPVALTIGRHVANLITDGMTLHLDCGPISAAAMRYLDTRKDLGIHTDIVTDDLMRLIDSGAVT